MTLSVKTKKFPLRSFQFEVQRPTAPTNQRPNMKTTTNSCIFSAGGRQYNEGLENIKFFDQYDSALKFVDICVMKESFDSFVLSQQANFPFTIYIFLGSIPNVFLLEWRMN